MAGKSKKQTRRGELPLLFWNEGAGRFQRLGFGEAGILDDYFDLDVWDPQYSDELLASVQYVLANRNGEPEVTKSRLKKVLTDVPTAANQQHVDTPNRKSFDSIIFMIPQKDIAKVIYDKHESIQEKLTTIYSTIFSLKDYGLIMLIDGKKEYVDLFVGVVTRKLLSRKDEKREKTILQVVDGELDDNAKVLKNAFLSNFPGTELIPVNNIAIEKTPPSGHPADAQGKDDIIKKALEASAISAVSSIPALRNSNEIKNDEFVQGLEKFIDTMKGKKYSAFIIADAVGVDTIEQICAEYEDIYSQLAPFKASSQTVSKLQGKTDTESIVKGITDTTNETVARSLTHGSSTSKTHTDSVGGSVGVSVTATATVGAGVVILIFH